MARTVKAEEYAEKRKAILDVAQRYIAIKGYEQMTTQDILEDLQISKGAFYHYFDSKAALLFALIERMGDEAEQRVLPILHDSELSALDKLVRYFTTLDQLKREHMNLALAFGHVWYADENAIVRHKLYITRIKRLTPWFTQIIQEGIEQGTFTTPYPEEAARMIIALQEDLGFAFAEAWTGDPATFDMRKIFRMIEAMIDALERILGIQPGYLLDASRASLAQWQVSLTEQHPL